MTDRTRFASLVQVEVVVSDPRPLHSYVVTDLVYALVNWNARSRAGGGS
ncbi:hypothetical protein BH20ACT19_BH20ACT19_06030 [soil metagenome]